MQPPPSRLDATANHGGRKFDTLRIHLGDLCEFEPLLPLRGGVFKVRP